MYWIQRIPLIITTTNQFFNRGQISLICTWMVPCQFGNREIRQSFVILNTITSSGWEGNVIFTMKNIFCFVLRLVHDDFDIPNQLCHICLLP